MSDMAIGATLAACVFLLVAGVLWWTDHRDGRRHREQAATMAANHRTVMVAINQFGRLEATSADHAEVLADHADLLDELRPMQRAARRPAPRISR